MSEPVLWGIHAGRTGDADSLFLGKGLVAIGWAEMGDLSKIPAGREGFKAAVAKIYPDKKLGAIPTVGGQLYRFVHEIQPGNLVLYPSKHDRQIHIGRIEGLYVHDPKVSSGYPNQRSVKWLKAVPRDHFTQGALYEIGSAMSLFQVRNYADEFRAVLEGKQAIVPAKGDETVAAVAEDIEENTRDFILKTLAQELKGIRSLTLSRDYLTRWDTARVFRLKGRTAVSTLSPTKMNSGSSRLSSRFRLRARIKAVSVIQLCRPCTARLAQTNMGC